MADARELGASDVTAAAAAGGGGHIAALLGASDGLQ